MPPEREIKPTQEPAADTTSSDAVIGREKFSISKALVAGATATLLMFGLTEAWIVFPAVIHHLDGPSTVEVLNLRNAEYLRQLPDVTKMVGVLSGAFGLLAGAGYQDIDEEPIQIV